MDILMLWLCFEELWHADTDIDKMRSKYKNDTKNWHWIFELNFELNFWIEKIEFLEICFGNVSATGLLYNRPYTWYDWNKDTTEYKHNFKMKATRQSCSLDRKSKILHVFINSIFVSRWHSFCNLLTKF